MAGIRGGEGGRKIDIERERKRRTIEVNIKLGRKCLRKKMEEM